MTQPCHRSVQDTQQALAELRQAGAGQFDPIGLHHLEVLAQRTAGQQGEVKRLLEGKLALAHDRLKARFEQAHASTTQAVGQVADKQGQTPPRQTLASLVRDLTPRGLTPFTDPLAQGGQAGQGLRPESTATRYFRATWSKLNVGKRVAQALDQAPKNAGPINSHMLVLRSLALMRDISPDYLNRFATHVDTLLCLDQISKDKQASTKKTNDAASPKKPKPRQVRPKS